MRKSRFLALFLTVVFVLANVTVPSFAGNAKSASDIIGMGTFFAPVENLPFHISHKVADEEATYSLSKAVTGFSVDETDGLLNITSAASVSVSEYVTNTVGANVNITVPGSDPVAAPTIAQIYSGFSEDFQDGDIDRQGHNQRSILSVTGNNVVSSDGSGEFYAIPNPATTSGNTAGKLVFNLRTLLNYEKQALGTAIAPFVVEMDFKGLQESVVARSGNTAIAALSFLSLDSSCKIDTTWKNAANYVSPDFDFANFNANDGKWHSYKWVITPSTASTSVFDLYIDSELVVKGKTLSYDGYTATALNMRIKAEAVDNLKRYGTSLGFAHDVKLGFNSNEIGASLTASAQMFSMPTSNIPEALEYNFVISDTVDSGYEYLASAAAPYIIKEADTGKFIRVAARVKETAYDECATDWVYSNDYVQVAVDPWIYGNPADAVKTNQLVAPLPGLPLHIAHTSSDPEATYALGKSLMSVSADGILNIPSNIASFTEPAQETSVSDKVTITLADGSKVEGPQIGTVNSYYNITFDDDKLAADSSAYYIGGKNNRPALINVAIVTDEETGRKYGQHSSGNYIAGKGEAALLARKTSVAPFVWEWEMLDLHYSVSVGATTILDLTEGYEVDTTWLDALPATAEVNPDFDLDGFNSRGWHKYKYIITPTTYTLNGETVLPHFDIYIDNVLLVKNVPMTGIGADGSWHIDSSSANYTIQWYAKGVDNYKRYGTSLGFAHDVALKGKAEIGSIITASAKKAAMPLSNIPEALEYAFFACDTADGEYVKVADGASLEITSALAGKYIKSAARVKESIEGGLATEWVFTEDAYYIPYVSISSIALTVDGEEADFDSVAITGDASIAVSITAEGVRTESAKFVLAQYAKVNDKDVLKAVDLENAVLGASDSYTLEIDAEDVDANTVFKLFALTTEGLVPVKFISFN